MSKGLLTVVPLLALAVFGARPAHSAETAAGAAGAAQPGATPQSFTCNTSDLAACLLDRRFEVAATFTAPNGGPAGNAHMVQLTDDSAYLWFFSSDNVEVVLKVLNGCALNSRYWFFAGGLTNVDVVITVTDSNTGTMKQYHNPQGTPFQPIQDTSALPVCP
ncbi:MAG TPA: hypothetical protein VJA16_14835 [Thermoanaerobaculia bacterium]